MNLGPRVGMSATAPRLFADGTTATASQTGLAYTLDLLDGCRFHLDGVSHPDQLRLHHPRKCDKLGIVRLTGQSDVQTCMSDQPVTVSLKKDSMHIAPIPLGLTVLGAGLLIGPANEAYYWFFVRDPFWILRDPLGWMQHARSGLRSVIVQGIIGLVALAVGIIGLIIY